MRRGLGAALPGAALAGAALLVAGAFAPASAPRGFAGPFASAAQREALLVVDVVDQDGNPLAGVELLLSRCRLPFSPADPGADTALNAGVADRFNVDCREVERVTDAEGRATFPGLRIETGSGPGFSPVRTKLPYGLAAVAAGFVPRVVPVELHPARNTLELVLRSTTGIRMFELYEAAQARGHAGDLELAEQTMSEAAALLREAYAARSAQAPTREIFVDALSYLASLRLQLGADAAVIELLEEVLSLDPWNRYATRTSGVLAAQSGDWGLAKYHFGAWVFAEPDNAEAFRLYGRAHLEMNQLDGAIEHLQRSIELDPSVAQAHRSLGVAYERAGRSADAVASYERYLEFPVGAAAAAEIRDAIVRLRR